MCGIFAYKGDKHKWGKLKESVDLISYRGPDNSHYDNISNDVLFAFHRLAIMGVTNIG